MALVPGVIIGDNPSAPSIAAELFIPDQLVAGNMKIVSESCAVAGSSVLQRGTVMGLAVFGTLVGTPGKVFAHGTVTIAQVPTSGDTVTVQGTAVTFLAVPVGQTSYPAIGNEVIIDRKSVV